MPRHDPDSCTTMILGYSRWGFVDEAFSFFQLMMPLMRNSAPRNAMIAAYVQSNRFHEALALLHWMRAEQLERIGREVIELEPNNSERYMALANLRANAGQWEDAVNMRKLMNDWKVRKALVFSRLRWKVKFTNSLQ
ncbi:hypothetical protein Tsubulata_033310, partial [Turnera subulata]